MPRILRIINRFNLGGPTYNVSYLTKYLPERYETLLVGGVPDEGETASSHILEELGIEARILSSMKRKPGWKNDRETYQEIKTIIEEFKPDIVHTHASKAGALGRKAAFACKVPVVVHTFHGHVFDGYFGTLQTNIYKAIERYLAKKTDGIVAISPEQVKDLTLKHRICEEKKVKMIPLGFDLDRFFEVDKAVSLKFRNQYGISSDAFVVTIIGRLAPIKNHRLYIDALVRMANGTSRTVKALIVGDGSEKASLQLYLSSLSLPANLEFVFTSWIADIAPVLVNSQVVALTSNNEGTPVSLIESLAAGVPVVATQVGGVKHIVEHGVNGFLVARNDPETFAYYLLELSKNNTLYETLKSNARKSVVEKFHYRLLVERMANWYDELLTQKQKYV